jgi:hypothetical protein
VREEDAADAKATPPSTEDSSAPIISTADVEATPPSAKDSSAPTVSIDDAPEGVQDDSNGDHTPDRAQGDSSDGGNEAGEP